MAINFQNQLSMKKFTSTVISRKPLSTVNDIKSVSEHQKAAPVSAYTGSACKGWKRAL